MDCQALKELLPLLVYNELSAAERSACEEHLASCAGCRAEREAFEKVQHLLSQRPRQEESAGLLAEARLGLEHALDDEQHGWRALWRRGLPSLRLQPASGFALALTLVLCG